MARILYSIVSLSSLILRYNLVDGLADGPPLITGVCRTLDPFGHLINTPPQIMDYEIRTIKNWFYPNEIINITITSTTSRLFMGLMLQVRDRKENFRGTFLPPIPSGFKHLHCEQVVFDQTPNSTISHSNKLRKASATFQWMSPASCDGRKYTIRATVVQSYSLFQTDLEKNLTCKEAENNVVQQPWASAPPLDHQCHFYNLTSIPRFKYTTSFESANLAGWNSTRWWINKGGTFTSGTGPPSAAHGIRYAYFETSIPITPLTEALLETDNDLRGCLCLRLKHNHNVDEGRYHRFMIKAGSLVLYDTMEKQIEWRDLSFQIDAADYVKIQILGIRGYNIRGDTAIDDVRITSGLCSLEDVEE